MRASRIGWLLAPVSLAACAAPPVTLLGTAVPSWDEDTPSAVELADDASDAAPDTTAGPAADATPTAADTEPAGLIDMLLANGALTPAQADRLLAGGGVGADPAHTATAPASRPADDPGVRVILDDTGLSVRSADGDTRIDIGGRVQVDATAHSDNSAAGVDITDGTELRRARLELKGTFRNGWIWAAEADFAGNNTSLKDFWAGTRSEDGSRVTFGHQKQPYSLALEMSSNDIPFTERGVDVALLLPFVDRAVGVRYEQPSEDCFLAVGLFGEGASGNPVDDEGWGAAGRLVHAPIHDEAEVLHVGVRGAVRVPMSSTKSIRIRDETTNMSNFSVVDTGNIMGVHHTRLVGAEAAYVNGRFSVIGEVNRADVDRTGPDYTFTSWSVETACSLTGESRATSYRMNAGEFKRLRPATTARGLNVTSGGAWELAARVADIDLTNKGLDGGEATSLTVGLNWYPTTFARIMLGATSILDTHSGSAATRSANGLDVVALRGQLTF